MFQTTVFDCTRDCCEFDFHSEELIILYPLTRKFPARDTERIIYDEIHAIMII